MALLQTDMTAGKERNCRSCAVAALIFQLRTPASDTQRIGGAAIHRLKRSGGRFGTPLERLVDPSSSAQKKCVGRVSYFHAPPCGINCKKLGSRHPPGPKKEEKTTPEKTKKTTTPKKKKKTTQLRRVHSGDGRRKRIASTGA